jgi:hypothetical protein
VSHLTLIDRGAPSRRPGVYLCRAPERALFWAASTAANDIYARHGDNHRAARAEIETNGTLDVALVEVLLPPDLHVGVLELHRFPVGRGGITLADGDVSLLERYSSEPETIERGKNAVEPEVAVRYAVDGRFDAVELLVGDPDPSDYWRTPQLVVCPQKLTGIDAEVTVVVSGRSPDACTSSSEVPSAGC